MNYTVTHRTAYTYKANVSASFGEAHLLPRATANQQVRSSTLTVSPTAGDLRERIDYFGNRAHFFSLSTVHTKLEVTATSVVDVGAVAQVPPAAAARPWEEVRDALAIGAAVPAGDHALRAAREYVLDSPQAPCSPAAAAYAVPSFRPGRPVLEAVVDLSHRIHADFDFKPGTTTVGTPVQHVLSRRAGVCQDFAHLAVSALRSMGLAARYVSGYLETDPPPGKPKLVGADVSHAWPSVFIPGAGWIDVDPTNDQLVGERYITTGWGRDYGDISPLRGVIFTNGETQRLEVSVDVRRTDPPPTVPSSQSQGPGGQSQGPGGQSQGSGGQSQGSGGQSQGSGGQSQASGQVPPAGPAAGTA